MLPLGLCQAHPGGAAAIGRREQDNSLDYTAWNAGVTYALTDNIDADLRYYATDADVPASMTPRQPSWRRGWRPTNSPSWRVSSGSPRRGCAASAVPVCCPE